ncbi:MAG: class III extradiol dioxygenase subunit B-like domain-containing protein [Actinomycetota bacterium]|nr:class III extradiol dioxygenase subunit B-like domain-containing protein [Actinomycetota bacterium]
MTLLAGIIAPHPPILIPQVGGEFFDSLKATAAALNRASNLLDEVGVEALIVTSPHSPLFKDQFVIRFDERFEADFEQFGAVEPRFMYENDVAMAQTLAVAALRGGVPLHAWEVPDGSIDWGVSVPCSYLGKNRQIISVSISTLSYEDHYLLGQKLAESLALTKKRFAFVASGDLSHRLTPDAPNGFSPRGLEFDQLICEIVADGRLADLKTIDAELIESAGECGLRSFIIMAGALSKAKVETKVLSYEGPFGVGYLVATMLVKDGEANV